MNYNKHCIRQCHCCGIGDSIKDGGRMIKEPIYGIVFYCQICIRRNHHKHD